MASSKADAVACRAELDALVAAWHDRGVGAALVGYVVAGYGCALLAMLGESWAEFTETVAADWKRRGGQP